MNGALRLLRGFVRKAKATLPPVFFDTFTGVNGTLLSAHTPDTGGPWTIHSGNATLNGSGGANITLSGVVSANVGKTDYTIVVNAPDGSVQRTVFRLTDASNYWFAEVDSSLAVTRIVEVVAGTPTVRASAGPALSAPVHRAQVVVSGTSVTLTLTAPDTTTPLTYASMATGLAATRVGLSTDAGGTIVNDITVT